MASHLLMMTTLRAFLLALWIGGAIHAGAQTPPAVDTSKIGPQVGVAIPAISGVDQSGKPQTLSTVSGPKGAMVVFFRSADW